ncbi:MAG: sensor domain-containing diguanylate cyclase [Eubacteriales bacterium]|nr:sensor domain-containing diguanylate cyclase [Eubacteriales bacterium]
MDYSNYDREQLLARIEELAVLNKELLNEKIQAENLEFSWTGNLGHWYLNFKTRHVVFNPLKIQTLGYSREELPEQITYDFFTGRLHPEDYEATMNAMRDHMQGKKSVYECEYRILTKDGSYKWFYDRGRITQRTADGKPLLVAGIVFDISERKEQEEKLLYKSEILEVQSNTDALTGIHNRRAIMRELELRFNQALANKSPLSLAIFDIDNFKMINDEQGHQYGDLVLTEIAQALSRSIREMDTVGRYGGEEFLLVLPETDQSHALLVAERIRKAVEDLELPHNVGVTISGGVAVLNPESSRVDDLTSLLEQADRKLYEAKNDGRNKVKV